MTNFIKCPAYYAKGHQAHNKKQPRTANPYNFKSVKGHLWDDGWIAAFKTKLADKRRRAKKPKLKENLQKNEKFLTKTENFLNQESEKK